MLALFLSIKQYIQSLLFKTKDINDYIKIFLILQTFHQVVDCGRERASPSLLLVESCGLKVAAHQRPHFLIPSFFHALLGMWLTGSWGMGVAVMYVTAFAVLRSGCSFPNHSLSLIAVNTQRPGMLKMAATHFDLVELSGASTSSPHQKHLHWNITWTKRNHLSG